MSGIRKESKKQVGFYFEEDERSVLKAGASKFGLNMSDWVKYLTHKAALDEGVITPDRFIDVITRLPSMPLAMREAAIREAVTKGRENHSGKKD